MASFGSFETDRELDSTPSYTTYSARKAGEARADYLVKVFHVFAGETFGEPSAELDPLLADLRRASQQRIALQQQASSSSPFVARVEESGQDDRGVWYVTPLPPRSVSKIISGRVALNRNALHHILHATASGALAFKQVCGRSHGELEPAVIHVGRSEKVEQAEVFLSDPLPGDESAAAQFETADLRAVGRILLQLVRQREIAEEDYVHLLPLAASAEWTNLFGKDAARWLELCNRLLDPNLTAAQFTLEQLVQELEQLRAKPAVSRGVLIGGGVVVLLLVAGGIFALLHFKRGGLAVNSDPPGAKVRLEFNGQSRALKGETPLVEKGLDKGEYLVIAELPGLPAQTNTVKVEGGKTASFTFIFACGRVQIVTTPEGASVILAEAEVGKTPYTSPWLPPGTNIYTLKREGHVAVTVEAAISANRQTAEINKTLVALRKDERSVVFESDPVGATFHVEGQGTNINVKAGDGRGLSYGNYQVTATLPGWPPAVSNLVVVAGSGEQVLKFKFPYGLVRFSIDPEDAELLLNEEALTSRQKKLLPRDYMLRVSKPGFHPAQTNFSVPPGIGTELVTNIVVKLRPMHGVVVLTSEPPGATLEITDASQPGKPFARVPNVAAFTTNLPPASYTFLARHDALRLDPVPAGPVFVAIGTNIPLRFAFRYGTLQFNTEPPGAAILIGDQKFTAPHTHHAKPGPVAYRVELEYYEPRSGTLELAAAATVPVSLTLQPKAVALGLSSDPPGAEFSLGNAPLPVTGGHAAVPWGARTITARLPAAPGLPGWEPQTKTITVAKEGSTKERFEFSYATLELTNAEAKLFYKNEVVANLPARIQLRPDLSPADFKVGYDADTRTNLPVPQFAAGRVFAPVVLLPELRRNYTNSVGMILARVNSSLYMGIFEVTEAEFQQVMFGTNGGSRMPQVLVSWQSAVEFCAKLTSGDAKSLSPKLRDWVYALPTWEEWSSGAGDDPKQLLEAVLSRQGGAQVLPADWLRKSVNPAGFFDLFGNVDEWSASRQTLGGSIQKTRSGLGSQPSRFPAQPVPEDTVQRGGRSTGFRCVLRAPAK